jgi:hypothetical protein
MMLLLLFVLFQSAWFACVWGGAQGLAWPGILATAALLAFLAWKTRPADVLRRAALGAGLGALLDGALLFAEMTSFPQHTAALLPLWMLALWAGFAGVLPHMVPWLAGRRLLAIGFGAIGGPLAYFSAQALGAIEVSGTTGFVAVAAAWAIAMALLPLEDFPRTQKPALGSPPLRG